MSRFLNSMRAWLPAAAIAVLLGTSGASAEDMRPLARPIFTPASLLPPPPAEITDNAVDLAVSAVLAAPETAEDAPSAIPASFEPPSVGPETNLPLPRFVSLKTSEGNVRRGPSLSHRIDWVFVRRGMPLEVTAEYGHWRRVVDREGVGGWVHYALISGNRSVIVDTDMLTLHARANAEAPVVAQLEAGVIARLGECDATWCRISAGGYRGWAEKTALWGVRPDEIRD